MRYRLSNGHDVHGYHACPNQAALDLRINTKGTGDLLIEVGYFVEEMVEDKWVKMIPQPIYSKNKTSS